jgi:Protein of unknown function (DUF1573)
MTTSLNSPVLPVQALPESPLSFRAGFLVAMAVFVVLASFTGVLSHVCFGGIKPGMAWWQGAAVFIEPPVRDLGEIAAGETVTVEFQLRSLRSGPVRIVGATPDCSCIVVAGLPLDLDDRGRGKLAIRFRPNANEIGQDVSRVIPLHLNVDSVATALFIQARVKSSSKGDH